MPLVTIRDVEIVEVGIDYPASTGTVTFTPEDLADAVRAQSDAAIKVPRIKPGHIGALTDLVAASDQPALGTVQNLRLSSNGMKILGDYTDMPQWLAEIIHSAYPSRSIEGSFNRKTVTGNTYRLVIDAVSLLGVRLPGCSTIEDIQAWFNDEAPEGLVVETAGETLVLASVGVSASVGVEDVRREYYATLTGDASWDYWIQAMYLEPNELIVCDEGNDQLYRVSFAISADDTITFGDPQPVVIQYVPDTKVAAGAKVGLITCAGRQAVVYASRSDSRPDSKRPTEVNAMTPDELRNAIGLPADATDEQVRAKLAEIQAQPPTPEPTSENDVTTPAPNTPPAPDPERVPVAAAAPPAVPAGMVIVPAEVWAQVQAGAQAGTAVLRRTQEQERDQIIEAALVAGKIAPAMRNQFLTLWEANPEGTKILLSAPVDKGGLAPNLVPVQARGSSAEADVAADSAYDESWLSPTERNRIRAAQANPDDLVMSAGRD